MDAQNYPPALKITLVPYNDRIGFEAGVGIFGQQAIPTFIMLFITWPVLLTQIWGMVLQSKLDDKALATAQAVIDENGGNSYSCGSVPPPMPNSTSSESVKFCTNCGTKIVENARFCSNCGSPLN